MRHRIRVARRWSLVLGLAAIVALLSALPASATHSWSNYHWARQSDSFTLKLGDNVDSKWDTYLLEAHADWNVSMVLDTTIVPGGTNPKRCGPTSGRVEVCNATYGRNGWLGLAQIWISGDHIVQGVAKMNDSYFNTSAYNKPEWRRLVMCQEVAHDFGLGHQDEDFGNPNLGSCMDYTSNPLGPPSNEHPNAHDFKQLETIYNSHEDDTTTVGASVGTMPAWASNVDLDTPAQWGRLVADYGGASVYVREFGGGIRIITHVTWAADRDGRGR